LPSLYFLNGVTVSPDPIGFLNQYDQKVILDEVQRVPGRFVMLLNRSDRGFKLLS